MKNDYSIITAIIFALIYFTISSSLMFYTYPAEDALILYRYVENFASTGEIIFNIGGEKTEGATDFLWFLILSLLNFIGLNVVFSVVFINTLSLLVIIYLIHKYFLQDENIFYVLLLFLVFMNIGPIIGSSIFGFSTNFFIFLGFCCYLSAINKKILSWTIFSILFCLNRPEGVFLFLPTILIIYKTYPKENKNNLYLGFLTILIVGFLYATWRYLYYENLLPLPLIVKSIGGETSIRRFGALGIQIINSLMLVLILSITYSFIKNYKRIFNKDSSLFLFISSILIWAFFLFIMSRGHLSQNIMDRYFAPFYFFVFVTFLYCFNYFTNLEKKIILLLIIISSLDSSNITTRILTADKFKLTNPTYKIFEEYSETGGWGDHPLIKIGKTLNKKKLKIMLTESGAIPYLSNKSLIYDIVGINNNTFSKRPINCTDIEKLSPDIIEIDIGPLNINRNNTSDLPYFDWNAFKKINRTTRCGFHDKSTILENFLETKDIRLIEKYIKTKKDNHFNSSVSVAANNIMFCLLKNENYKRIFNNTKGDQLYFVRANKDLNFLKESCSILKSGYFKDILNKK